MNRNHAGKHSAPRPSLPSSAAGFTLLETVIVVAIGVTLTALAIPFFTQSITNMRINSAVSGFTAAIASSRFQAIRDSDPYTLVLTAGTNKYVLTNVTTGAAAPAVPLPSYLSINGGSGTSTYTLCPNGIIYGAGGTCSPPPATAPPALSFAYLNRQINLSVSGTGNVTTTVIH